MKCVSALALAAVAAPSLAHGLKHVVLSNGESRVLSAASSGSAKQDAGPMTKAADSRPNVHNGGVNFYPYTDAIKNYIVTAHNNARATLVPTSAANMRQVSWDESLAIEAAELVNTCVFEHDTENYAYGQNLMYGGREITTATVDQWMEGWVTNEISASDRAGNGYMDLDHASAVLWANTYLVGCASKMCPNGYLTACNYYTPGNWQGERTYNPGAPCSQCPSQAPYCDATGKLCTAVKPFTPTQAPPPAPVPTPTPAPQPVPAPTPARTTGAPAPTPAVTTGSPIQQQDPSKPSTSDEQSGNSKPTPAPTSTSDETSGSATTPVKTDSPVVQRPITTTPVASDAASASKSASSSSSSVETPSPSATDKWGNFETSPATKPAMPGVIAALCGLVALVRAL